MALSALNQVVLTSEPIPHVSEEADYGSCDLARNLGSTPVYNQEAFRYFLANERNRSELSSRPFLLLLVDFQQPQPHSMTDTVATKLFGSLSDCLRETDVIGWYHEGRVAGAVLTHVEPDISANVPDVIRGRVSALLGGRLAGPLAARLQVRVFQLPAGLQQ